METATTIPGSGPIKAGGSNKELAGHFQVNNPGSSSRSWRRIPRFATLQMPHAKFDVTPHGLLLKPSAPAVPKTTVKGFSLIEA